MWAVPELGRVFASVTGDHEVAVVDMKTLKTLARIGPVTYPDGLAYAPEAGRLFVSDEHGQADAVIDVKTNALITSIALGGEAGNTVYDPKSGQILVAVHEPAQLVAIDPAAARIVARYPLPGTKGPHGVSLDVGQRLAFVAGEANGTLAVLDLESKKVLATHPVGEDPDVLSFDPGLGLLYVSAESGTVSVFRVRGKELVSQGQVTMPHAHTVCVDPGPTSCTCRSRTSTGARFCASWSPWPRPAGERGGIALTGAGCGGLATTPRSSRSRWAARARRLPPFRGAGLARPGESGHHPRRFAGFIRKNGDPAFRPARRSRRGSRATRAGCRPIGDGCCRPPSRTPTRPSSFPRGPWRAATRVDPATIVRTVQALGYQRYHDFAADLREHFVSRLTPYRILKASTDAKRSLTDHVRHSLERDLANLNRLQSGLDSERVVGLGRRIHRARRILVVGPISRRRSRPSSPTRSCPSGSTRRPLRAPAATFNTRSGCSPRKDLLVAISFGRCLRVTVEAAKLARSQRVPTVAITDSDTTPWPGMRRLPGGLDGGRDLQRLLRGAHGAAQRGRARLRGDRSQPRLALLRQTEKEYLSGPRWYEARPRARRGEAGPGAPARKRKQ